MPKDKITIVPTVQQILDNNIPVRESTMDRIYRENEVTHEMIAKQPRFGNLWQTMGGFEVAAEYLRGSEDPDAIKFMEVYDRVPIDEHDFLEFQGFCAAAKVSGKKLFGIIAAEAAVESNQKIALISAIKSPEVIDFTLDMARTPGGYRERAIVAKAVGYTPAPKGSSLIVNNGKISAGNTVNIALPAFDQDIRELGERFQENINKSSPKMIEGKVE